MSKHDTSILDQSAKKAIKFIRQCDDIEHLNALRICETEEFETPRKTILDAITERVATLATDDSDSPADEVEVEVDSTDADTDSTTDDSADKPKEVKDLTVGPALLGKTARRVFAMVCALTIPTAPLDEDGNPELDEDGEEVPAPSAIDPTAGQVANALGVKTGQVRSVLRTLRNRKLITLLPALTPEDRTYRYNVAEGAVERVAEGAAVRAARVTGSGRKPREKVPPMPVEEYTPLALQVGTLDRLIVRWSGTTHRERRAIDKEHGEGAHKTESNWSQKTIVLDGDTIVGTAKELVSALRKARNVIMKNGAFQSAQGVEEAALLVEIDTTVPAETDDAAEGADDDTTNEE